MNEKQLSITIANNAIMINAINGFLRNGIWAQSSVSDQNWKQTILKGKKAIIKYDQHSGYKLKVPLGQSTLIIFEGIHFTDEHEMLCAAEQFNVKAIKRTLSAT